MKTAIVIPARYASTRLPGKPLADICGLPMIVQVAMRAREAAIGRVVVAVDDQQVFDTVAAAGFEVVMTSKDHQSGSDRIFEALASAGTFDQALQSLTAAIHLLTARAGEINPAARLGVKRPGAAA